MRSIALGKVSARRWHDAELDDAMMKQLTDEFLRTPNQAHRDQRIEISLLALFSYDRLSIVLREKGWM